MDVASGRVDQLTDGTYYEHSVDWSPNGQEIAYLTNRDADHDEFFNYDIYALKLAEVRKVTPDPPAGTIDRDVQGNPTGVMKEAAQGLVTRLVPPFTRDQQRQGLVKMIEDFNKEGMTGAKDPGIGQQKWDLYAELLKEGKLTVRIFALWSGARRLEDNAQVLARVQAHPKAAASIGDCECVRRRS